MNNIIRLGHKCRYCSTLIPASTRGFSSSSSSQSAAAGTTTTTRTHISALQKRNTKVDTPHRDSNVTTPSQPQERSTSLVGHSINLNGIPTHQLLSQINKVHEVVFQEQEVVAIQKLSNSIYDILILNLEKDQEDRRKQITESTTEEFSDNPHTNTDDSLYHRSLATTLDDNYEPFNKIIDDDLGPILRYNHSDFRKVFKTGWLKTQNKLPKVVKQFNARLKAKQQAEFQSNYSQQRIDESLVGNETDNEYIKWVNGSIPKLTDAEWGQLVKRLSHYNYINESKAVRKFLYNCFVVGPVKVPYRSTYNDLIHVFARREDSNALDKIFSKMEMDGVSPNALTFNIIAKNYLQKTSTLYERLSVFQLTLQKMLQNNVRPDLCTWYIALSILPFDSPVKRDIKLKLVELNLHNVAYFTDLELQDMLNSQSSIEDMLQYYKIQERQSLVDVNCMNTIIFKYLSEDEFENAWDFMSQQQQQNQKKKESRIGSETVTETVTETETEAKVRGDQVLINPRSSTLTLFIKHLITKQNGLELALKVLNTFRLNHGVTNHVSHRSLLTHLLKLPDFNLAVYYPILVKFFVWYDLTYGIDKFRRTDILFKRLQYKLQVNYGESIKYHGVDPQVNRFNSFEITLFKNLENLILLDSEGKFETVLSKAYSAVNTDYEAEAALEHIPEVSETPEITTSSAKAAKVTDQNSRHFNDEDIWILQALSESCYEWLGDLFINSNQPIR